MINYKKKYLIFENIIKEKKYKNCEISYFDFFQKIIGSYNYKKKSILFLIKNTILFMLSCITIVKNSFKKKNNANYFIIRKSDNGFIDPRSQHYIKKKKLNKSINFVKSENFLESISVFFSYPNIIFLNNIKYLIDSLFFNLKKKITFENIHKINLIYFFILKKIFMFLKVNKIHMIDDYRVMPIILKICDELKIKSIGYSHGRISKYSISHNFFCFNKFYTWSSYFKKKILKLNAQYDHKNIIVNLRIKYNKNFYSLPFRSNYKTQINLLFVVDKELNEYKINNIIKKIKFEKKINLIVKLRPNDYPLTTTINLCKSNKIKYFYKDNIYEIILKEKINFLMATSSTMLLEASLMKIFPLMLITKNEYSEEMIKDKVVYPVYDLKHLYSQLNKINKNKSRFKMIYKNAWA